MIIECKNNNNIKLQNEFKIYKNFKNRNKKIRKTKHKLIDRKIIYENKGNKFPKQKLFILLMHSFC